LILTGLLGTVSVIAFGTLSAARAWAPEWQFNYLSWAFVLAVVGIILEHLAGILFLLEASIQFKRKERLQMRGSYSFSPASTPDYKKP